MQNQRNEGIDYEERLMEAMLSLPINHKIAIERFIFDTLYYASVLMQIKGWANEKDFRSDIYPDDVRQR